MSKTARLFEVAAQSVAIVAGAEKSIETAFQEYGRYLGTAFQLVDDVLDYSANAAALGKMWVMTSLKVKPTLPLLHAMRHGNHNKPRLFAKPLNKAENVMRSMKQFAIMAEHKSLDYAMDRAKQEAQKRLMPLPYYLKANTKSLNFTGLFIGRSNLLI